MHVFMVSHAGFILGRHSSYSIWGIRILEYYLLDIARLFIFMSPVIRIKQILVRHNI